AAPPEEPLADWEYAALHDFYDAEVTHQDAFVGRFLDGLRKKDLLNNTVVIIAADHGEAHGDHGFIGHSFVVYQELVHVPLIVRYPDTFPQGRRVQTNVSTRRIFHTVLDVTGITPPLDEADPNANVNQLTLHTSVNGRPDPEGGVVYSEAFPPQTFLNVMKHRAPHMIDTMKLRQVRRGIYDGNLKLTTIGENIDGLFDVSDDPNEVRSIADAQPDITGAMRTRLDSFSAEAVSRRVDGNEFKDVDEEVVEHLRALGYID
ncbi:MAG: sulfatase-like hydrolase/transferase, partial [Chloroflexota bacterium]